MQASVPFLSPAKRCALFILHLLKLRMNMFNASSEGAVSVPATTDKKRRNCLRRRSSYMEDAKSFDGLQLFYAERGGALGWSRWGSGNCKGCCFL